MKATNKIIPLVIFLVVGFQIFRGITGGGSSGSAQNEPEHKRASISAYGDVGIKSDWPNIEEGFSQVSDDVSAANYYLVLDGSGSMADSECSNGQEKLKVAKDALRSFISKLPGDANVGLYSFDQAGIGERLPLGKYSSGQINQSLNEISAGGGTPLSEAVQFGYAALSNQGKKQLGYGEYHLVIVTDGEANRGYDPGRAVRQLLESSPIVIHTMGFCIDDRHSLNQPGYTLYKAANNPAALSAGLESVLAEAPDFSVSDFGEE